MNVQSLLMEVGEKIVESRADKRRRTDMLLRDVFQRVITLRQARRRFADQIAPDFHLFDYLRTDETGLSRCLADLLDPGSCDHPDKHGQGGLFLDAFLQHLAPTVHPLNLLDWASAEHCERVATEHSTNSGRRIDILIKFNNGGLIGIENKPWACDQKNQLTDYAKYLSEASTHERWLLIFLSDREPSPESLANELSGGHFLHLDYGGANAWLQSAMEKTRSIKVRIFVEELMKFIRTQVSGEVDMTEEQEIKKSILSTAENLEAAYLVHKTFYAVKLFLTQDLQKRLLEGFVEKPYRINPDQAFFNGKADKELEIQFCGSQKTKASLVYGFTYSWYRDFYFGIRNSEKGGLTQQEQESVRKVMNSSFGVSEPYDAKYPWFIHGDHPAAFGTGFRNWQDGIEPWEAMRDGSLAKRMIQIADEVYAAFQKEGHVALLCGDGAVPANAEMITETAIVSS